MLLATPVPNQALQPGRDSGDNTYFDPSRMTSLVDSPGPLFFLERELQKHSKREAALQHLPLRQSTRRELFRHNIQNTQLIPKLPQIIHNGLPRHN